MIQPYYTDPMGDITIYNADCLEVMPQIPDKSVDLALTDPPYPDYHTELYQYKDGLLDCLKQFSCRQLVFWSAKVEFPLDYTAIHIWDKKVGCGSWYERVFERNGNIEYKVYREYLINSIVAGKYTNDIFTGHNSQKPIKLIKQLVNDYSKDNDLILDPFLGSGTTAVACKQLNRRCIGIEISQKYCDIAIQRLKAIPERMFK